MKSQYFKKPSGTNEFHFLASTHEQRFQAKRKKVKYAAAKKEDFFVQPRLAYPKHWDVINNSHKAKKILKPLDRAMTI